MSETITPQQQRALQLRNQIVRCLIDPDPEPERLLERLPGIMREVGRLAAAAVYEMDPPSEERDEVRLVRLLKESADAAKERGQAG